MNRLLNFFRRSLHGNPSSAVRRRPVRLQLEELGDRIVPSASSAISIYHPLGQFSYTERDWYSIDRTTNQVVEFQGTSRHNLAGPGGIFGVSASVDPNTGYGEVFALQVWNNGSLINHGPLWVCNSQGIWQDLGGDYGSLSATRDGHVYAISSVNGDVYYVNSNGAFTDLSQPAAGTMSWVAPAASHFSWFGSSGNEVFVIGNQDGAIYVNSANSPGHWRLVDNSAYFESLSATRDDTVFAVTTSGKLYQETEHLHFNGWYFTYYWAHQDISGGMLFTSQISADVDAAGNDEVYAITAQYTGEGYLTSTGDAYLYDQGSWTHKDSDVFDIAGADGGYFYDVNYAGGAYNAWQFNPNTFWTWLGSGLY
jgi:hypothetical protein